MMMARKTKVDSMHGHAMQQLSQKYVDLHESQHNTPQQPFNGQAKGVLAGMWLSSIVALACVLAPSAAQAADGYQLRGEIYFNGQRVAQPEDHVEDGREAYLIMQSDEHTIRLTYTIQSAGDNLVDTRFLIERDDGDGDWQTLMQPAVQAIVDQQASVVHEAEEGSDEYDVEFFFTILDRE